MARYLIATIRHQADGRTRELYASTAARAAAARDELRRDPARVECGYVSEYVDVSADGRIRIRIRPERNLNK